MPGSPLGSTIDSESLEGLTVPDLKARLKEASLPVSGRKADLIDRLQTQFASSASTSTEAASEEAQTRALRP